MFLLMFVPISSDSRDCDCLDENTSVFDAVSGEDVITEESVPADDVDVAIDCVEVG